MAERRTGVKGTRSTRSRKYQSAPYSVSDTPSPAPTRMRGAWIESTSSPPMPTVPLSAYADWTALTSTPKPRAHGPMLSCSDSAFRSTRATNVPRG